MSWCHDIDDYNDKDAGDGVDINFCEDIVGYPTFSPQPSALKVEDVLATDDGEDDDAEEEQHEDDHDRRVLRPR